MIDKFQKFTSGDDNFIRTNDLAKEINRIIGYINKQEELAASTGNSSRITPNNGETPVKLKVISGPFYKKYGNVWCDIDEVNYKHHVLSLIHPKHGIFAWVNLKDVIDSTKEKDNPVASLDDLIQKILSTFGISSNNGWAENKLNKIFQEYQNARTTDKEKPTLYDLFD